MHEVLTIQLGQVANFVGTHFWNAQVVILKLVPLLFSP
jgi:hypothetical protein